MTRFNTGWLIALWLALDAWSKVSSMSAYKDVLQTFEPNSLEQMACLLIDWLRKDTQDFHWRLLLHEWCVFISRDGFKATPPIYGQRINNQILWPSMGQLSSYVAFTKWNERYKRTNLMSNHPLH